MRRSRSTPLLACLLVFLSATHAFGQPAAIEEPPLPPKTSSAVKTIRYTGYTLTGLGVLTFMASGIVWLTAAADASRLDDECPNKKCVRGTTGGDALEAARDEEKAADVLLGISLPVMTAGLVLVIYSGGFPKRRSVVKAVPSVSPRAAGGRIEVAF
jgi:hypothetical protein